MRTSFSRATTVGYEIPSSSSTSLIFPRERRKTSTNASWSRLSLASRPTSKRPSTTTPQEGHSRRRTSIAESQLGQAPTSRAIDSSLPHRDARQIFDLLRAPGPALDARRGACHDACEPGDRDKHARRLAHVESLGIAEVLAGVEEHVVDRGDVHGLLPLRRTCRSYVRLCSDVIFWHCLTKVNTLLKILNVGLNCTFRE